MKTCDGGSDVSEAMDCFPRNQIIIFMEYFVFRLPNISFILALRAWILHEDFVLSSSRSNMVDIAHGDRAMARALDVAVAMYHRLATMVGVAPNPNLLLDLGPDGQFLHAVACQVAGTWAAFFRCVVRRHPELALPPAYVGAGCVLGSYAEWLVCHAIQRVPGIEIDAVHPRLGDTQMKADFSVTTLSKDRLVYVEVSGMIGSNPAVDTAFYADYRRGFMRKIDVGYVAQGLALPVAIGADDLAPGPLEAKMNEIRMRLALTPLAPRLLGWYGAEYGGSDGH